MMNKRKNSGFTLVEVLVVVGIIALLAGIGAVAFSKAKKAARMHTTKGTLAMIGAGAEMFKNDFGSFPPSDPSTVVADFTTLGLPHDVASGATALNSGAKIVCFLLTGYANDVPASGATNDGTPESGSYTFVEDDGNDGFGFRTKARGKVHGPYGGAEAAKTAFTENNTTSTKVFIDGWKHAIFYYRYDTTNDRYNANDNDATPLNVKISDNNMQVCPVPSSIPSDYQNKFNAARKDFLLVSPGDVEDTFDWKEAVTNTSVE